MLRVWDKCVYKVSKSLGQVLGFYTLSTVSPKSLTGQAFIKHSLSVRYEHLAASYKQSFLSLLHQLAAMFYTLSPRPMANTKLIKDSYS